jgi:hypothetical protein
MLKHKINNFLGLTYDFCDFRGPELLVLPIAIFMLMVITVVRMLFIRLVS